jgi:hypothetical protein
MTNDVLYRIGAGRLCVCIREHEGGVLMEFRVTTPEGERRIARIRLERLVRVYLEMADPSMTQQELDSVTYTVMGQIDAFRAAASSDDTLPLF